MLGLGVSRHIGKRFLNDAEQLFGLTGREQVVILHAHGDVRAKALRQLLQRRRQAQVVQQRWAQIGRDTASRGDGFVEQAIALAQTRVLRQSVLHVQFEHGECLAELIVHVARQATTFGLDALVQAGRQGTQVLLAGLELRGTLLDERLQLLVTATHHHLRPPQAAALRPQQAVGAGQ
jgi:hypothetical protein